MTLLAAITETDVAAWSAVAIAILGAIAAVGATAIAVFAKLGSQTAKALSDINAARLDRHGTKLSSVESDMTTLALATAPTPPASASLASAVTPFVSAISQTPSPTVEEIADAAVRRTLTAMKNATAAAKTAEKQP